MTDVLYISTESAPQKNTPSASWEIAASPRTINEQIQLCCVDVTFPTLFFLKKNKKLLLTENTQSWP